MEYFDGPNTLDVLPLLLNIREDLDKAIFNYLLLKCKIILLFDGYNEISSKIKTALLKLIRYLKTETKIQIWISTQPNTTQELVVILET